MDTKGFVVPPEKGIMWAMAPGRSAALKMLTRETAGSVMIFEEVAPVETDTPMHTHDDSDEIAYVLSGEITFNWPRPAAWTIGPASQNAAAIIAMVIDLPTVFRP